MNKERLFGLFRPTGRQILFALSIAVLGLQFVPVGQAAAGKPPAIPDYPIKVQVRNAPGDKILSVGDSKYTNGEINTATGQVDVSAKILSSTGWVSLSTRYCETRRGMLDPCKSLGRYHTFDFSNSVSTVTPLPVANGWNADTDSIMAAGLFEIWPLDSDGVTKLPNGFRDVMNKAGETRLAGMKVNFRDSTGSISPGSTFTVRFTPNFTAESSYVLVTYLGGSLVCSFLDTSKCASWTVETIGNDPSVAATQLQDIAGLVNEDNSINYGTFRMPFKFTVSVLPTK